MRVRAFTPTGFYVRGSQVKVHPGALPFSVSSPTVKVFSFVTHGQSFRFRHPRTKPISVSIDCFFHMATAILTGAITMIQTRRGGISSGVLHPHHSVLKQIKLFDSDSQALEASTYRCTPFCSVPFCVTVVTPTPETQPRARAVLLRRV